MPRSTPKTNDRTRGLDGLFRPRSVAVVGASRRPGSIGRQVVSNLIRGGFQGPVYPVNPKAEVVLSVPAFATVAAIPGPVDLAVLVVPPDAVLQVAEQCGRKRVKGLVVITAGFREIGGVGERREQQLQRIAARHRMRVIGPNCMGIVNTEAAFSLDASFASTLPRPGAVAMVSQSGALGEAILADAAQAGLGVAMFASVGNRVDVTAADLLAYWADDDAVRVVLLYLETVGEPHEFVAVARRVARKKPIIAVKSGRSDAGAAAASSHTGSVAGADVAVDTLLAQCGVLRVDNFRDMFALARALLDQPLPRGGRMAVVTNAGGPGILAADACEANGLIVTSLTSATTTALRAFLPAAASVANPVDMIASASPEHYRRTIELVLTDSNVDSLLTIFIPPIVTAAEDVAQAIQQASAGSSKPVLATFMGVQSTLAMAGIPTYTFPESAAVALARVTEYGEWRRRPTSAAPHLATFDKDSVRMAVADAIASGGGWLDPSQAERLLRAAGIDVVPARVAHTLEQSLQIAQDIGWPVAMKGLGPTLLHKTEAGAVKLGLKDSASVRSAFTDLSGSLGGRLEGVLIQRMVDAGIEMVAGGVNDPLLGPVIMAGTGGIFVELVGDTAFRMCPLTEPDADSLIEELKGRVLLRGYRGAPAADESAFRTLLLALSQLLDVCPEIEEMDLNPVMVLRKGTVVVDSRIKVGPLKPSPRLRRIAY